MTSSPCPRCPLALYLTWNTYGSWPQGDPHGWIRRADPLRYDHDPAIVAHCRERQREPTVTFTAEERAVVADSIDRSCAQRGWPVHGRCVRTQHVHLVVSATMASQPLLIALKGEATRALRARWPTLDAQRLWARRGYVVALYTERALARVVAYVHADHHR